MKIPTAPKVKPVNTLTELKVKVNGTVLVYNWLPLMSQVGIAPRFSYGYLQGFRGGSKA